MAARPTRRFGTVQPHSIIDIDPATRSAVDAFIDRLTPRFAVREAILFGSRARGDARPDSDADLAVVLRGTPAPFMETKLSMADAAFDAMLNSGIRIQPLPLWDADRNQPDRWLNPELLHNIEQSGIRVWQTPAP